MNTEVSNLPVFSPEVFLNIKIEEKGSTTLPLVPEGMYTAVSDPVGPDSFSSFIAKTGERAGQRGYRFTLFWNINDESGEIQKLIGRKPKVKQGMMLQVNGDSIAMGTGENVTLNKLREVFGLNKQGVPFAFPMLGNQVAKVQVKHRPDDKNPEVIYAEVVAVTKA